MKNSTRRVILAFCVTLLTLMTACKAKTALTSGTGGGGGGATPLTAAQIEGTHSVCIPITDNSYGTTLFAQNYVWYRTISLDASGLTYSMNTFLYQGTDPVCFHNTEIFVYWQSGTFELGSVVSSGATEILYTTNPASANDSGLLTAYPAGWINAIPLGCPHITPFTASSWLVSGDTCNQDGLSLEEFPPDSSTFYDLVSLDSKTSPTKFTVSPSGIFSMGQFSSYPTTATFDYTF